MLEQAQIDSMCKISEALCFRKWAHTWNWIKQILECWVSVYETLAFWQTSVCCFNPPCDILWCKLYTIFWNHVQSTEKSWTPM